MMHKFKYCLYGIIILNFIFCFSCQQKQQIDTTNFQNDSIAIANHIQHAIMNVDQADSLLIVANNISNSNDLKEIYNFHLSRFYIQTGAIEKASLLLDSIIGYKKNLNEINGLAKFYNLRAAVAAYKHEQQAAVNYYKEALEIYDSLNDNKQKGVIEFNLANIFFSRLDYASAYKYITSSIESFNSIQDSTYLPQAYGILAVASIKSQNIEEAENSLQQAKSISDRSNNMLGKLIVLYAQAEQALFLNKPEQALDNFLKALQFSQENKLPQLTLPIHAALLNTYNQLGKYQEALQIGKETLKIAQQLNNKEILYSLNKNLAFAYAQSGNNDAAYNHILLAHEIFSENATKNNQEIIQKLLIEYETEKKNNKILEQENEIKQQNIRLMLSLLFITIIIGLFLLYRNNVNHKRKIVSQQILLTQAKAMAEGEETERKRLAQELHDGIASNLVAIRMQLEILQNNLQQKIPILSLVKDTHTELRTIAHNLMPIDFETQYFNIALEQFTNYLSNDKLQVSFYCNEPKLKLPVYKATILYRCVQELIQNVIKHAEAEQLNVQIIKDENNLVSIIVEDDGKGVNLDILKANQKGIYKYASRLANIDTHFIADSNPNSGTTIILNFNI